MVSTIRCIQSHIKNYKVVVHRQSQISTNNTIHSETCRFLNHKAHITMALVAPSEENFVDNMQNILLPSKEGRT